MSFFSQVTQSFANVPTDGGIETAKFLTASADLVKLFDFLGSSAFAPVKSDMNGNIEKIKRRFSEDQQKYSTLQKIVESEAALPQKQRVGTEGLMWLRRGFEFTSLALRRSVDNPAEELTASFSKAYESTLQKHHNMFIRPIFHLAMKACPYRKDFYKKLSGQDDEAKAIDELKPWLVGLENIVKILVDFYQNGKYECNSASAVNSPQLGYNKSTNSLHSVSNNNRNLLFFAAVEQLRLSQEERLLYSQLFQIGDIGLKGYQTAMEAVVMWKKSKLPDSTLGTIWNMVEKNRDGSMGPVGFVEGMRLIAAAQQSKILDQHFMDKPAEVLPKLENTVSRAPSVQSIPNNSPPQTVIINASNHSLNSPSPTNSVYSTMIQNNSNYMNSNNKINRNSVLVISEHDRSTYIETFKKNSRMGIIDGPLARKLFQPFQLSDDILAAIWNYADTNGSGKLDCDEFVVAMTLIHKKLANPSFNIPDPLTSGDEPSPTSTSSNSTITNVPEFIPSNIDPKLFLSDSEWFVPLKEFKKYENYFIALDTEKKNYLNGEKAASFFSKSGLSDSLLAEIWALVDIDDSGNLNRSEFAAGMHLIRRCLIGKSLPESAPASLFAPPPLSPDSRPRSATGLSPLSNRSLQSFPLSPETKTSSLSGINNLSPEPRPQSPVDVLKSKLSLAQRELSDLTAKKIEMENQIRMMEGDGQDIKKKVSALEQQKKEIKDIIVNLQGQTFQISKDLLEYREKMKSEQTELTELNTKKEVLLGIIKSNQDLAEKEKQNTLDMIVKIGQQKDLVLKEIGILEVESSNPFDSGLTATKSQLEKAKLELKGLEMRKKDFLITIQERAAQVEKEKQECLAQLQEIERQKNERLSSFDNLKEKTETNATQGINDLKMKLEHESEHLRQLQVDKENILLIIDQDRKKIEEDKTKAIQELSDIERKIKEVKESLVDLRQSANNNASNPNMANIKNRLESEEIRLFQLQIEKAAMVEALKENEAISEREKIVCLEQIAEIKRRNEDLTCSLNLLDSKFNHSNHSLNDMREFLKNEQEHLKELQLQKEVALENLQKRQSAIETEKKAIASQLVDISKQKSEIIESMKEQTDHSHVDDIDKRFDKGLEELLRLQNEKESNLKSISEDQDKLEEEKQKYMDQIAEIQNQKAEILAAYSVVETVDHDELTRNIEAAKAQLEKEQEELMEIVRLKDQRMLELKNMETAIEQNEKAIIDTRELKANLIAELEAIEKRNSELQAKYQEVQTELMKELDGVQRLHMNIDSQKARSEYLISHPPIDKYASATTMQPSIDKYASASTIRVEHNNGFENEKTKSLMELMKLGFSQDVSLQALEASGFDTKKAVNYILDTKEATSQRKKSNPQYPNTEIIGTYDFHTDVQEMIPIDQSKTVYNSLSDNSQQQYLHQHHQQPHIHVNAHHENQKSSLSHQNNEITNGRVTDVLHLNVKKYEEGGSAGSLPEIPHIPNVSPAKSSTLPRKMSDTSEIKSIASREKKKEKAKSKFWKW